MAEGRAGASCPICVMPLANTLEPTLRGGGIVTPRSAALSSQIERDRNRILLAG
jgi:hypothetical protein